MIRWLVTHNVYVPEWLFRRHLNKMLRQKGYKP